MQIKSAERGSVSLLPLIVLFGFLLRLVLAEFCYYLEGEGGKRFRNCSLHSMLVPGTFIYVYFKKKKKRERGRSLLGGDLS